jgi:hypothetical protein
MATFSPLVGEVAYLVGGSLALTASVAFNSGLVLLEVGWLFRASLSPALTPWLTLGVPSGAVTEGPLPLLGAHVEFRTTARIASLQSFLRHY